MPTDQPANWDATRPWGTTPDAAAVPVPDAGDDTLREQLARILTEHQFAFSVDRCAWLCACSGPPMPRHDDALRHQVDALLPRIREHVAAAVQAERERADRLVSWKDTAFRARDEWRERAEATEAAIERAHAVHREHTNTGLVERCKCLACDMIRALDGTEAAHG